MFSHRPPIESTVLPLTESSEVTSDLNNIGDDDNPEKFDQFYNHTQTANDVARSASCKNFCLSSERGKNKSSRARYGMDKNGVKHES